MWPFGSAVHQLFYLPNNVPRCFVNVGHTGTLAILALHPASLYRQTHVCTVRPVTENSSVTVAMLCLSLSLHPWEVQRNDAGAAPTAVCTPHSWNHASLVSLIIGSTHAPVESSPVLFFFLIGLSRQVVQQVTSVPLIDYYQLWASVCEDFFEHPKRPQKSRDRGTCCFSQGRRSSLKRSSDHRYLSLWMDAGLSASRHGLPVTAWL